MRPLLHRPRAGHGPRPSLALALTALSAVAVLAGCASAARVKTEQAPAPVLDVSAYRTYGWGTPEPVIEADVDRERDAAVLEYTIRDAVDRELAAKGYQRVEGSSPDFLVDFGIRLEEKSTDTFGEYIAYRDLGGRQDMGSSFVFGYEEGTLLLEVTDARSRERAWSGSKRTVLDDGQDVAKLESAVGAILAPFPAAGAAPAVGDGGSGSSAAASPAAKPKPKIVDLDRYIYVPEP